MKPESDTPRTDAAEQALTEESHGGVKHKVYAAFARELERDLATEQAKAAAALSISEDARKECDDKQCLLISALQRNREATESIRLCESMRQTAENELAEANRRLEVATKHIAELSIMDDADPVAWGVKNGSIKILREMGVSP